MKNLIKTLFICAITTLLFTQNAEAKTVKFAQITDSHFSTVKGSYTQRDVEYSKEALENTIKDINSLKEIDFVAFTGDNIDTANEKDLKLFLQIANKLNVPYYIVIGNHEVFKSQDFGKKEYLKILRKYSKNCKPSSPNYVFEKNGFVFLVVDGAKETIPGPAGYYKKDTLLWLDKTLTKYEKRTVVILQHFPIVEPYYNRSHTTYNIKDYEDILKKHNNVIAIFSGHYHANAETKKDGIYHVSTPSLVEAPHNYKVVEINVKDKNDSQIYTQLRHAE
jgi:3',5'-cyclic AMP phosphodiesterase CpdA